MAGTLLHITLADEASQGERLPRGLRAVVSAHPDDYHLGSVLVDLPYFEHLFVTGLRVLARQELHLGVWGDLLHMRSPRTLCVRLLTDAEDDPGRAMALGFLTHMAVDRVFHKEIERRVWAAADGTMGLNALHKHIEDEMDLHVHLSRLGHPGMGTRYAREALALRPHPGWKARFQQAVAAVHGSAPGARRLERWRRELALFGLLNASPIPPWTHTEAGGDDALRDAALGLAAEAVALAGDYLQLGWAILQGEKNIAALEAGVPDLNLAKGVGNAAPPVKGPRS